MLTCRATAGFAGFPLQLFTFAGDPFSGFANTRVLLVDIAFLVALAVVKSGLGRRISLFMVSIFGRSSVGLAYSIVRRDQPK